MAYTVPHSFNVFIQNISLTGDHKETAEARRKHIVSLLENNLSVLDSFATGSIIKDTGLKSSSDLDIILVLHWSKHIKDKTPEEVLQEVRDVLGEYRTNVRKNGQAVTLHYKSWPNVDIVPVSRVTNNDGTVNYYRVPDMTTDQWLNSRPRKHAKAIENHASQYGYQFKPIIRMIKQWNKEHSGLMESYHIEVLALKIFSDPLTDYAWDIYWFFKKAVGLCSTYLPYEDGYADDYLDDDTKRHEVVKRLETARDKALLAWHNTYAHRDDHKTAIETWRQIFGTKFPAYGE